MEPKFGKSGVVFIQWKGTDVCLDFVCECGLAAHYDGYFAYSLSCPSCDRLWKMPSTIQLTEGEADNGVSAVLSVV